MIHKRFSWAVLAFALLMLLTSACSVERKMAQQFVKLPEQPAVMVLMPQYILLTNERYDKDELDMTGLNQFETDSLLKANTVLLNKIDDTLLLRMFETAYLTTLRKFPIQVYEESNFESFYQSDSLSWVVNVAQMEMQEFIENAEDIDQFFGMSYSYTVPLNAVNLAAWFEFSKVNGGQGNRAQVMFGENNLYDQLNGQFIYDYLSGEVGYRYEIDSLSATDVYDFAAFMGRLFAGYTYDYLLNSYVRNHAASQNANPAYFRYDPFRKQLFMTQEDRFIPLDDQ